MQITADKIKSNLPFTMKMTWVGVEKVKPGTHQRIVEAINKQLSTLSSPEAIDSLVDNLATQFPAIQPIKKPLGEALKKALNDEKAA
jgi:hypothetical protein